QPTSEIAVGRIIGPYQWSSDPDLVANEYNNVRPVKWLGFFPRTFFSQAALHSFGSFLTVSTSDDYLDEVEAVLRGETVSAVTTNGKDVDLEEPPDVEDARNLFETAVQETEDYLLKSWQRTGNDFE